VHLEREGSPVGPGGGLCVRPGGPGIGRGRQGHGDVRGRGAQSRALKATKDMSVCGTEVPDESILVAGGKLENVVVTIEGAAAKTEPGTITLDQHKCRYVRTFRPLRWKQPRHPEQ